MAPGRVERAVGGGIGELLSDITQCEHPVTSTVGGVSLAGPVTCPYPNPWGFASVFPFPSPSRRGRGVLSERCVVLGWG